MLFKMLHKESANIDRPAAACPCDRLPPDVLSIMQLQSFLINVVYSAEGADSPIDGSA